MNEEAERLVREEGVFTNIVLSHSGYDVDQQMAANASDKISLIVGAHSHTFLYTGGKFYREYTSLMYKHVRGRNLILFTLNTVRLQILQRMQPEMIKFALSSSKV